MGGQLPARPVSASLASGAMRLDKMGKAEIAPRFLVKLLTTEPGCESAIAEFCRLNHFFLRVWKLSLWFRKSAATDWIKRNFCGLRYIPHELISLCAANSFHPNTGIEILVPGLGLLNEQYPLADRPISLSARRALFLVRKPGFAPGPSASQAEMLLITPQSCVSGVDTTFVSPFSATSNNICPVLTNLVYESSCC